MFCQFRRRGSSRSDPLAPEANVLFFQSQQWRCPDRCANAADQGTEARTLIVMMDVTDSQNALLVQHGLRRRETTEFFMDSGRTSSDRTVATAWL